MQAKNILYEGKHFYDGDAVGPTDGLKYYRDGGYTYDIAVGARVGADDSAQKRILP